MILMSIVQVLFFIEFTYYVFHFFGTEKTNELIKWGVLGSIGIMASTMLNFYTWMQMDKKAIIREIKRLELQVFSFSAKITE